MAQYEVIVPFAGYFYVRVDADTQDAAIDAAFERAGTEARIKAVGSTEVGEWETLHKITRGNVCYAPANEASAELIEDEDTP